MKNCNSCKQDLPKELYANRGGGRYGTQATCIPCSKERTKLHRKKMRALVGRWKMLKGCKNGCSVVSPVQLDLDHRDPSTKTRTGNSRAFEPSWSRKRIKEELSKCDVLCKNCHALKTFNNNEHIGG